MQDHEEVRAGHDPRPPGVCLECGGDVDASGCCWHCCNRLCLTCDRLTGSAFFAQCIPCELGVGVVTAEPPPVGYVITSAIH